MEKLSSVWMGEAAGRILWSLESSGLYTCKSALAAKATKVALSVTRSIWKSIKNRRK